MGSIAGSKGGVNKNLGEELKKKKGQKKEEKKPEDEEPSGEVRKK